MKTEIEYDVKISKPFRNGFVLKTNTLNYIVIILDEFCVDQHLICISWGDMYFSKVHLEKFNPIER